MQVCYTLEKVIRKREALYPQTASLQAALSELNTIVAANSGDHNSQREHVLRVYIGEKQILEHAWERIQQSKRSFSNDLTDEHCKHCTGDVALAHEKSTVEINVMSSNNHGVASQPTGQSVWDLFD